MPEVPTCIPAMVEPKMSFSGTTFYDAASEPKQLIWYATGHEMKLADVDRDRTQFLKKQLEMK